VVTQGNTIIPYQITWYGREPRHEKALHHFYAAFPQSSEAIFITQNNAQAFLEAEDRYGE
jgi:hypothetical protein